MVYFHKRGLLIRSFCAPIFKRSANMFKHRNTTTPLWVVLITGLFYFCWSFFQVNAAATPMISDTSRQLYQPGGDTIQGSKWHDLNGNGIRDTGEPGLSGWTIFLDTNNNGQLDGGESSTLTDSNGDYAFIGLTTPFTYTVAELLPSGWQQSYPRGVTVPSGNILVTTGTFFGSILPSRLYEYTLTGTQVSSILVPYGSGSRPTTEIVRDVVMGNDGQAYIYNGTFNPYLSIYNFTSATWQHHNFTGWSTVNNVSYGGIALDNKFVYLSDMVTAGSGSPVGIVRFDRTNFTPDRFTANAYIDLTRGLDGFLYALRSNEQTVDVYDQQTNCGRVRTITLGNAVRGIAVNAQGEIFGASLDDRIYHFSPTGTTLNSIASGGMDLTDIDLASDGTLVVGERFGQVILTDESLSSPTTITDIGNVSSFVGFATLPIATGSHRVGLTPGGVVSGIDFGNFQGATVGDRVWQDLNQNGLQDSGEPGFAGINVHLVCLGPDNTPYTADDLIIDSAMTNGTGIYGFANVSPGTYYLDFVAPTGYQFTLQDQGGDDTIDSDANSSGLTIPFPLTSDQFDDVWDAGLYDPTGPTPTLTPTFTATPTATPTDTPTHTTTPSPTSTPTSSATATTTPTDTPTSTATVPSPFTPTPTISPTDVDLVNVQGHPANNGLVIILLGLGLSVVIFYMRRS
jgi:hypothetical protein